MTRERKSFLPVLVLSFLILMTAFQPFLAIAKVKLTIYHRNELREMEWMDVLKKEFEEENRDIELELVAKAGGGINYAEILTVMWASGNPPDIIYGSVDRVGFINNGWIRDIADLYERDREEIDAADFVPGGLEEYNWKGRLYGIPITVLGQAIFYNKQLFDEAGLLPPPSNWSDEEWTWEKMISCAKKLTKINSDQQATQFGLGSINGMLHDIALQFGGGWFPEEAYHTSWAKTCTLVSPQNIEAYTAVQDLYLQEQACAGGPTPWTSGVNDWNAFMNGNLAMEWMGWWKVRNYVETFQSGGMNFQWGIAPVPLVNNRLNTRFVDPWFISSKTNHVEQAWRFVKYATSTKGLQKYARIVAFPPARKSAMDAFLETVCRASGSSEDTILEAHLGTIVNGHKSYQEIMGSTVWSPIINDHLNAIMAGEKSPKAGLAQAQEIVNALLAEMNR